MRNSEIPSYVLDAIPYPILFVDMEHIIRYLNKTAKFHYYQTRGYSELNGKSLFDCHNDESKEKILAAVESLKKHSNEVCLGVGVNNQRIYVNPVRDEHGNLVGYFERFELNQRL
jgi:DUF438 domain-containing protein